MSSAKAGRAASSRNIAQTESRRRWKMGIRIRPNPRKLDHTDDTSSRFRRRNVVTRQRGQRPLADREFRKVTVLPESERYRSSQLFLGTGDRERKPGHSEG